MYTYITLDWHQRYWNETGVRLGSLNISHFVDTWSTEMKLGHQMWSLISFWIDTFSTGVKLGSGWKQSIIRIRNYYKLGTVFRSDTQTWCCNPGSPLCAQWLNYQPWSYHGVWNTPWCGPLVSRTNDSRTLSGPAGSLNLYFVDIIRALDRNKGIVGDGAGVVSTDLPYDL